MLLAKDKEIEALCRRIEEVKKLKEESMQRETKRISLLLSEANVKLKKKEHEIIKLRGELAKAFNTKLEEKNSLTVLNKENIELKGRLKLLSKENEKLEDIKKQQEEDIKQERDLLATKGKLENAQKLHKQLSKIHKDIITLSKTVTKIFEGQDPNIQSLWGVLNTESDCNVSNVSAESILEDTGKLRMAVESIRTSICDYYADKYSNHCTY
jgi:alanyl-tRNA synthetase